MEIGRNFNQGMISAWTRVDALTVVFLETNVMSWFRNTFQCWGVDRSYNLFNMFLGRGWRCIHVFFWVQAENGRLFDLTGPGNKPSPCHME